MQFREVINTTNRSRVARAVNCLEHGLLVVYYNPNAHGDQMYSVTTTEYEIDEGPIGGGRTRREAVVRFLEAVARFHRTNPLSERLHTESYRHEIETLCDRISAAFEILGIDFYDPVLNTIPAMFPSDKPLKEWSPVPCPPTTK